jgi:hypothetical protein
MISQSDFASLAIENELADERAVLTITQNEANFSSDPYVSVNFIPDEVFSFIAEWETSTSTAPTPPACVNLDNVLFPVSTSVFEPPRRLNDFAPPKRFYRTFWRSVSRRILQMASTQRM